MYGVTEMKLLNKFNHLSIKRALYLLEVAKGYHESNKLNNEARRLLK